MTAVQRIPVAQVYGNPNQPRKAFDEAELRGLAASIKENGLLQPITVRPDGEGRYMIVAGERRFRAHRLAGIEEISALVSQVDDEQLAIDAIVENDQRVDITPLETARAYQRAMDEFGLTEEDLARKLGKPLWRIQERTNLLRLTPQVQKLLESGALTSGHAWYLVQLDARKQDLLVKAINSGQCQTTSHLKAMFETIRDADAQDALFGFEIEEEPATPQQRAAATRFDARVKAVTELLNASIVDNEIKALRKVKPHELASLADLFAAMAKDVARIETALRVAAAAAKVRGK